MPSISAPALSFVLVKEKFAKALAKIDASTEVEITPKTATSTSHSPVKADKKQIKPPVFPSVVATALKLKNPLKSVLERTSPPTPSAACTKSTKRRLNP